MSKRVYLVTLHTGNTLTVHSHKFVRGRTVMIEDEKLINYLSGHPNFTIVPKVVDDGGAEPVASEEPSHDDAGSGVNTAADLESGMSPKTPVTNVAKNPTPRRSKASS